MQALEYIQSLDSARDREIACDRYHAWISRYTGEWTEEMELEYSRVIYLDVLAQVAQGSTDFTSADIRNYRNAAQLS